MPEKRFMSPATMADYYDLSKGFIYGHIGAGNLAAKNIGKNPAKPIYRISTIDADAFMDWLNDESERAQAKLAS